MIRRSLVATAIALLSAFTAHSQSRVLSGFNDTADTVEDELDAERQRLLYTLWIQEAESQGDRRLAKSLRNRREQFWAYARTVEESVAPPDDGEGGKRGGEAVDAQAYDYENRFDPLILKYSRANGVSPYLVKAVIKAESNFNPFAVSSKKAFGLMQIMPLHFERFGLTTNTAFDPERNIAAGVTILSEYLARFDGQIREGLIAYQAGPGNVGPITKALDEGRPVSSEITGHLARIIEAAKRFRRLGAFE